MTINRSSLLWLVLSHATALAIGAVCYWSFAVSQPNVAPVVLPTTSPAQQLAFKPPTDDGAVASVDDFLSLIDGDRLVWTQALTKIENNWQPGNLVMLVEVLRFVRRPVVVEAVTHLINQKSVQVDDDNIETWYREIWQLPYQPDHHYASFKARLYERIDPRFAEYFHDESPATIRLDEIRWGGVRRDGIPPLKNPKTLAAAEASYLADTDIVFGVEFNGQARAYPKRILAWHEMVKDIVGGKSINGVYCTLCGSMIVYRTLTADGKHYEFGTSGFLYRSNKLMYDYDTKSMWSTIDGEPVVGPLVGKGIKLEPLYVVTTTWSKWKADHPDTSVLSLATGHQRDYNEGAAYRGYFATDDLMFGVAKLDRRLKNKAEVFVIRQDSGDAPTVWSLEYLVRNPLHHVTLGKLRVVIVTDETGANRAYESNDHRFDERRTDGKLIDAGGQLWDVNEAALVSQYNKIRLPRLPSHRAFWFGWYSAHPDTLLIQ